MDLITIDFETYYDKDFSLSKLTTEEYVRDHQFEVIGVGIKVNNEGTEWASGTREQLKQYLHTFNWAESMVLAHNTLFDGAILSWVFDIHPRVYTDTLCIARALHGVEVGGSLRALSERYQIGTKGTEVLNAIGKRRADFSEEDLALYGDYCINDVELTYKLFNIFLKKGFPKQELMIIDMTLRMFTEPFLELDIGLLEQHLEDTRERKDQLLEDAGVSKEDLMSNPKFATLLEGLGVKPPMKISLRTGKETFAFAKTDEGFKALATHEDDRVQAAVAARLGTKSTLEETRTQRFIGIGKRGTLPVPVRYYAAHTGRWGGDDKINMQNLPSRGLNAKKLKRSILAPEGHTLIDCDSSQIEARVLAWLAGQNDITRSFANNEDVYKVMASRIYGVPEDKITKEQRFVGKTTILGAGYGMGAVRFQEQLEGFGFEMGLDEARRVINIYREANWKINQLWRDCQNMIKYMVNGDTIQVGREGVLKVLGSERGILLPSGLMLRYDDLLGEQGERGVEYSYKTRRGRTRIYGGKVTENICQAVARCIIGEQMLQISKRCRIVLMVHDSIVVCVKDEDVIESRAFVEERMRWTPDWATGLPINCESGLGKSYGDCE
jgi:DNA polymerase I-like protein with 3'-5' exonuclease and polymerase domains|tara:strand:+ start:1566 stop:3395 length:1830 start_codon:yes stop_codon:yes gene_type:complete